MKKSIRSRLVSLASAVILLGSAVFTPVAQAGITTNVLGSLVIKRTGPGDNYPDAGDFNRNQIITIDCWAYGTNIVGNNTWDRLQGSNIWIPDYYVNLGGRFLKNMGAPQCDNVNMMGWLDSVSGSQVGPVGRHYLQVNGWAVDPNSPAVSIPVHIYIGGPAGKGEGHIIISTNIYRPDVNRVYPWVSGFFHGFYAGIYTNYMCGHNLPVYAYGIDVQGIDNTLLGGSPKYVNIPC